MMFVEFIFGNMDIKLQELNYKCEVSSAGGGVSGPEGEQEVEAVDFLTQRCYPI